MNNINSEIFINCLKKEVAPALGCTEPVAIAFAAATASKYLNEPCTRVSGFISENLYRNAKGVTIPGTTCSGIEMSAAVGVCGGDPEKGLETLAGLMPSHVEQARMMVNNNAIAITARNTAEFIHIDLTAYGAHNHCRVVISKSHTGITGLYLNDKPVPFNNQNDNAEDEQHLPGNDSNLLVVIYHQIMPDDFVMQFYRF